MAEHLPQLELGNQLCFALYRASRAAVRAYGPVLGELGITYPQYLVLLVLWEADEPMSVGAIGEHLHLDSGTLTPLLKRLQDQGLVTRERDPDDERRVLVAPTAAGRAMRKRAATIPAEVSQQYGVAVSDARDLITEIHRIADAIEGTVDA
jgi:DNA-binding MarR family transcriptional regulator